MPPTNVVILGSGIVGETAARAAIGLGATVKIFDNSLYKLKRIQNNLGTRIYTSTLSSITLSQELKNVFDVREIGRLEVCSIPPHPA